MVGSIYRGELAILSVNGAGGKDDAKRYPSSDAMYGALRNLRTAAPGALALAAFDAFTAAVDASIPDWPFGKRVQKVLDAAQRSLCDIAYLYVVPFRIRGDAGATMRPRYLEKGYDRHLIHQLRAVAPKVIIALDSPSRGAAQLYQREAPQKELIYYTGKRDAHTERTRVEIEIRRRLAGSHEEATT
jgi:hypothetical protein